MIKLAEKLARNLSAFKPEITTADTGSVYVKLSGCKVKQVRFSNHKGRKTSPNCWEFRTDAVTGRYKTGRVYGKNSMALLISDLTNQGI